MIGRLDSEVAYWKESMEDYISVVKREPLSVEAENREILKAFTSLQVSIPIMFIISNTAMSSFAI